MADILIRGMEMPKERSLWLCIKTYGTVYNIKPGGIGMAQAVGTAVPLPEGHGDLIDRDAFRADNGLGKDCENCDRNTRNCNYDICLSRMDVCGWIDDAPTIVPAEGGTDNGF